MPKSIHLPRLLALLALALAAVVIVASPSSAHGKRTTERLVVRGEATVEDDGSCPAGVCTLTLADGEFRGTPVGTGAYTGALKLKVAEAFSNGENGVCAPIAGRIVLGEGTPDRLTLGVYGDSCQDGSGPPPAASFTSLAHWTVEHGTGAYEKARGRGLMTSSEGADDLDHMTLIGRISR